MDEDTKNTLVVLFAMFIGLIILVVLIVLVKAFRKYSEHFIDKSEDGYYWDTDSAKFVSTNDKDLAIVVLLRKLNKIGITDITSEQLHKLPDSSILDLLDLDYDQELTVRDIAALRMYINPRYYLASTYVNQAIVSSNKFENETQRKLVYDMIMEYYKLNRQPNEIAPLSQISDADIIKEFELVRTNKTVLESNGYATVDMDKVSDQSTQYAKGSRIISKPKIIITDATVPVTEAITPIVTPAMVK